MNRNSTVSKCTCVLLAATVVVGCAPQNRFVSDVAGFDMHSATQTIQQVNYEPSAVSNPPSNIAAAVPFILRTDTQNIEYWDLTIEQALQLALTNSSVLRDLGGMIIQSPAASSTIYDPSIRATDPRFGAEAALSAFDATFSNRTFFEKNNRALNNSLLGGGTNFFKQDLWQSQTELSKHAATGAVFSLRHNAYDDLNNSPANIFGTAGQIDAHAWTWDTQAEVRQPLLQGGGVGFNRIAGPNATPGVFNGVVIARIGQQQSAAEFQIAIRNYLSNVENAYWELVFAYRDLDSKKQARDRSLQIWQQLKERSKNSLTGAENDKLAQATEQYFRYQDEVETALNGRPIDGTRDYSGSTGGTFQGIGGVYIAERRFRLVVGAPINDNRLIRPVSDPVPAKLVLDWPQLSANALCNRPELIRQRLRVKQREMELIASRNFLLPKLDAVGRYTRRGLGDHLYDPHVPNPMPLPMDPDDSVGSGTDEWQVGLELEVPIGFRQANSGVRNAELLVARERALASELERQVIHDLSDALSEEVRSQRLIETSYNRRIAADSQYRILTANAKIETIDFNVQLESIRRLDEAETAYNRLLIGHAVALKNLYVESGDLLHYCNITFSDPASEEALPAPNTGTVVSPRLETP